MISDECKSVLQSMEREQVHFVDLLFTGIMGELKCVTLPVEEMQTVFEEDKGVDGSSVLGFARLEESDQVLVPDPATFRIYPYAADPSERTACLFCNVIISDQSGFVLVLSEAHVRYPPSRTFLVGIVEIFGQYLFIECFGLPGIRYPRRIVVYRMRLKLEHVI